MRPLAANVIVPQARAFAAGPATAVEITGVQAGVVIIEQVGTTTLDIGLRNPSSRRIEAELVVPVPPGAVVRGFAFEGAAAEPTAVLLSKDEARSTYDAIVAKARDPALLEFAGCNLIRSSVFPIPARGVQKVRLTYEHLLTRDGARVDYELPRSEVLEYRTPWEITVRIESARPVSTIYSPSHELDVVRGGPNVVSARMSASAAAQTGPFRLSCLLGGDEVCASLLAYPDPSVGGGYFLLLAGLPAQPPVAEGDAPLRREVTLVLDRSGSMSGEKIEQVRAAAQQVIAGLGAGEAFNLIAYNDTVERLSSRPLLKTAETEQAAAQFLARFHAAGSTNIHEALLQALDLPPTPGALPLVLFLTDGLPTTGNTSEIAIRKVATDHNPHQRRIFTFGVGADVNTPLLQKIAAETRGTATFVLPRENVEAKVAQVFKGLQGPVLIDATLAVAAAVAGPPVSRVSGVMPARLPDLFQDDQLVVLGQYAGTDPLDFELRGNYLGHERAFHFHFSLDTTTTRNAFVPRLWASRRIANLADAIRQMGAEPGAPATAAAAARDPKLRELTEEIVRLSTEFGILTEYTAFLAREGTDLSKRDAVLAEAAANFQQRAMAVRSGMGAVNQALNVQRQMAQQQLNHTNEYLDENMNRVSIANVQQISDRAFFQRGQRWVDSRVVGHAENIQPHRVVEFGTDAYRALTERLAAENRQGTLALRGDVLLLVGDELVLVKGPPAGE
jgi:Ca-activated chloride channel family protein